MFILLFCKAAPGNNKFKFDIDGFVSLDYGSDQSMIARNHIHLDELRMTFRPIMSLESGKFRFQVEADFAAADVEDANWLKEAWVKYHVSDSLSFRTGRIPTTTIMLTPPPRFLQTARQFRVPFGIFGGGAQMHKKWDKFTFAWDVTTDTDLSFQSHFEGFETSLRLKYQIDECWWIAGNFAYDFTDDHGLGALSVGYQKDKLGLSLVGYTTEEIHGAYCLAAYRIAKPFEIHAGLDWQSEKGLIKTAGIRWLLSEKTDLALDWIFDESKSDEDDILAARLRHRF